MEYFYMFHLQENFLPLSFSLQLLAKRYPDCLPHNYKSNASCVLTGFNLLPFIRSNELVFAVRIAGLLCIDVHFETSFGDNNA